MLATAVPVSAAKDDSVRLAFLLNLAKYVDWPVDAFASAEEPLVIGVLQDADFASDLTAFVADRTVNGRGFEVRIIENAEQARECHLLFGPRKQKKLARALALELKGEPILSVAEYDRFTHVGGMVGLKMKRGKISFEISRSAADRGGLTVSSKLLRLASAVR